ncbi:hypothetical protein R5H30_21000 [Sulfitobacter sp. D35]|uniref:hypothetical protein n=1 Tax=Sulfitobacter sp. D35 TaxID=3083252 RepID=UPI00296FCD77|nr:hypothetical protein [Sulfitobacter sp. D35]MDW4500480.1 hypothetical protein [Sulfitobacter sp. D35]
MDLHHTFEVDVVNGIDVNAPASEAGHVPLNVMVDSFYANVVLPIGVVADGLVELDKSLILQPMDEALVCTCYQAKHLDSLASVAGDADAGHAEQGCGKRIPKVSRHLVTAQ